MDEDPIVISTRDVDAYSITIYKKQSHKYYVKVETNQEKTISFNIQIPLSQYRSIFKQGNWADSSFQVECMFCSQTETDTVQMWESPLGIGVYCHKGCFMDARKQMDSLIHQHSDELISDML